MLFLQQSSIILLFCLSYSVARNCLVREGQPLNISCDTNSSEISSIVWKVTKHNTTLTLFNCTLSRCYTINSSDLQLFATVNVDPSTKSIVSSSLTSSLVNVTNNILQNYSHLICEFKNESIDICQEIEIHAYPQNVTCNATEVVDTFVDIECIIYPSGHIKEIRITTNNVSTAYEFSYDPYCYYKPPELGQLYYTAECSLYLDFTKLGPGNHQINVIASPDVGDSNLNISSNNVYLPITDELEEPTCTAPTFRKDDVSFFTIDCSAPLYYMKVGCKLYSRTNRTGIKVAEISRYEIENTLDYSRRDAFALSIHCEIFPVKMGIGQHEFQVECTSRNKQEKIMTRSSNWTAPVNFYIHTEMNFTVNGSPDGVSVSVGDNVTFHCTSNGFPPAYVYLHQDETSSTYHNYIRLFGSNITLPIISCKHAGLYICISSGRLEPLREFVIKKVYVNIPCPFRSDTDSIAENNRIYVGTFTQTSRAYFRVFGYPAPTSMRLSPLDKSLVTDGVDIVYKNEQGPYGNIAITFRNIDFIKQLSNFTLSVDNGVGSSYFDFSIQAAGGMSKYGSETSIFICFVFIMSSFFF